ncbi:MAG TPA: helix-turn-helix domain-containing protein [Patescibacteria group bacterium]|jgi:transposase|nr:helix-turn-helix domain-containing protein [Patescibacteria group bacterium]
MNKAGASHPPYDAELKNTIIKKIRDEGMTGREASTQYGVSSKTIYRWLQEGVVDGSRNLILENNRLKKELEIAYRVLGRAKLEMERSKS